MIVDDHTLFRAGLKLVLQNAGDIEVVGEATTGDEALTLVATLQPDVLLLDLSLADVSGMSVLSKVAQRSANTKVIIVTMHNDAALVRAALAAGAKGYLVKTAADTEVITAIRTVAKGRTFVDLDLDLNAQQLGSLLEEVTAGKIADFGPLARLSKREREVFRWLAEGHTNQEIANRMDLSVKTIETYRARIFDKFGLRSRADLIRFAVECGILAPESGRL